MKRRQWLAASATFFASSDSLMAESNDGARAAKKRGAVDAGQRSAGELAADLAHGTSSAEQLLQEALERIARIDRAGPTLNSVLALNPDAAAIARGLDAERRAGRLRGPLHGLPLLLKDNIATGDRMPTTAGSLALEGVRAARDAHVAKRLREAGVVIVGKSNLSEWANIRSTRSVSGWSGRGGLTRNPYALDRSTSGSSSGSAAAVAAGLVPLAVGTETNGSIVSPASICGLVGLKPTVGSVSRDGIVPISHTQDTAGPMTRTVLDAALLFAALRGKNAEDAATAAQPDTFIGEPAPGQPLTLPSDALRGARIGVARRWFTGFDEADAVIAQSLAALQSLGAELVDPVELPFGNYGDARLAVLLYELKADLPLWLARFAPQAKVKTLADVIAFNRDEHAREMPWFGQELFERAEALGDLASPAYLDALATCARQSRTEGLDKVLQQHRLDAIVAPTTSPAWLIDPISGDRGGASFSTPAAVAGYPHLTVPAGLVRGLPLGLSFVGPAWSEWKLLAMGHAFEQATQARRPPTFLSRSVPVAA